MDKIRFLLLIIILLSDYIILRKYKSVVLNITTIIYITILPFYYLIQTSYWGFWENAMYFIFYVIIGLNLYYSAKLWLSKTKDYKKIMRVDSIFCIVLLAFKFMGKF